MIGFTGCTAFIVGLFGFMGESFLLDSPPATLGSHVMGAWALFRRVEGSGFGAFRVWGFGFRVGGS